MNVTEIFLALDKSIELSVESYLKELDIFLKGRNRRKQLKLLGVPSLARMVDHSRHRPESPGPAVATAPKEGVKGNKSCADPAIPAPAA
jgi:hypothetical protein